MISHGRDGLKNILEIVYGENASVHMMAGKAEGVAGPSSC